MAGFSKDIVSEFEYKKQKRPLARPFSDDLVKSKISR